MTLTAKQKAWDKFKAVQRAERQPVAAPGGIGMTFGPHVLSGTDPMMRTVSGRAKQRAARRPNRKQSGRAASYVDRGIFNINTGHHEPLPRIRLDATAIA